MGPDYHTVSPFFFWIGDTNTLTYIDPGRGRRFINENSKFPHRLGDPVAAKNLTGALEVFWVSNNENRELHYAVLYGTKNEIVTPQSLGGNWSPNSRPVIAENADGTLGVFITGLDKQLYHRYQIITREPLVGVAWKYDWVSLGGQCIGDPVVARNAAGNLEVFVIGEDNKLFHRWQDYPDNKDQWSNWDTLEKVRVPPRSKPAVGLNPDGRLELFIVADVSVPTDGLDGTRALWHTGQTSKKGGQWSTEWDKFATPQSFPLLSNPAIAYKQDGRIELFARSSDLKYYHRWQTSKNSSGTWDWSEWEVMP